MNELIKNKSYVVEQPDAVDRSTRYVSIFEDPSRFGEQMQIAEALSQTQFIPQAFRGKAADCLVALDLACRFQLQPLAIFPELYVIDNRASFSSKFLIALVNRSGRFSRIQWEEGIDGEHETVGKIKTPNYYAKAYFTEKATGERFESPVVDIALADKNGWLQKSGSKWKTLPEVMCRYRSASILIKSVCPEIIAGLEFAEDVQDAQAERSDPQRSIPITVEPVFNVEAVTNFTSQIEAAKTLEDLRSIATAIASANLNEQEVQELRLRYKEKNDLIKKTSCNTQTANDAFIEFTDAIAEASTLSLLGAIEKSLNECKTNGTIEGSKYNTLKARIDSKRETLEE